MTEELLELYRYRELLMVITFRDIKVRYKQSIMGFLWAILMPILIVMSGVVIRYAYALASHVQAFPGVTYVEFLIPGLAMMAMLQNSFANSSSSLIQSKITGNIVFILLPPLSAGEIFAAYLLASIAIHHFSPKGRISCSNTQALCGCR